MFGKAEFKPGGPPALSEYGEALRGRDGRSAFRGVLKKVSGYGQAAVPPFGKSGGHSGRAAGAAPGFGGVLLQLSQLHRQLPADGAADGAQRAVDFFDALHAGGFKGRTFGRAESPFPEDGMALRGHPQNYAERGFIYEVQFLPVSGAAFGNQQGGLHRDFRPH